MISSRKLISFVYLIFFSILLVINYSFGRHINEEADKVMPLLQPAGYAFAIWTVIYALLAIWILRGFFVSKKYDPVYLELKYVLPINFVLNSMWVLTFTNEQLLWSVIIIVLIWATRLYTYLKVKWTKLDSFWNIAPFSVYLGWITIAMVVNLFLYLVRLEPAIWNSTQELTWSIIALIISTLFAVYTAVNHKDWLLPLVFLWGYTAIAVRNANTTLTWTALICSLVVLIAGLYVIVSLRAKHRFKN